MKREMFFCGDPVLRKKAKRVREIDDSIRALFEDMKETMDDANGVGLAAPQIGEPIRMICVREDLGEEHEVHCLLNPVLVEGSGKQEGMEGCLSLPTLYALVIRSEKVLAQGTGLDGNAVQIEAEGLLARALQHEIDHLNGVLFIDRAEADTLSWMVPDKSDEDGFRWDPATFEEAQERFNRLREARDSR